MFYSLQSGFTGGDVDGVSDGTIDSKERPELRRSECQLRSKLSRCVVWHHKKVSEVLPDFRILITGREK